MSSVDEELQRKMRSYQITVIFSVLFALLGFSYNVWRMEVSEENNNIRTASFEILKELAALEQLIYAAHYDGDMKEGSPRKGWVKVGLIQDLSKLTSAEVYEETRKLKGVWTHEWENLGQADKSIENLIQAVDSTRTAVRRTVHGLN